MFYDSHVLMYVYFAAFTTNDKWINSVFYYTVLRCVRLDVGLCFVCHVA